MKKLFLLTAGLCIMIWLQSCSSNVKPIVKPKPPTEVDSTGNSDSTGTGDSTVVKPPSEEPPVISYYKSASITILNSEQARKLYLGATLKQLNTNSIADPSWLTIDPSYRKPFTILTDLSMDDFMVEGQKASKATDQLLINKIAKEHEKGVQQIVSFKVGSPTTFANRFNSLRDELGINQDLKDYLGLDFDDTTRLDTTKGRILISFELIKESINVDISVPPGFFNIDASDQQWQSLFGSENAPLAVSSITYGAKAFMVLESDSSAKMLADAFKHYNDNRPGAQALFPKPYSDEDKKILQSAVSYGYSLGKGPFSHNALEAINQYEELLDLASDIHQMGHPIFYKLVNVNSNQVANYEFELSNYKQKVRQ